MALALDTLEYARRLRECGFNEQQAEGQARALASAMTDSLATKHDLEHIGARIDRIETRIDGVEARIDGLEKHLEVRLFELEKRFELRLDGRLADLERRLTLRLGAVMAAGVGIFATLVRVL